jgi:hypothetical protein
MGQPEMARARYVAATMGHYRLIAHYQLWRLFKVVTKHCDSHCLQQQMCTRIESRGFTHWLNSVKRFALNLLDETVILLFSRIRSQHGCHGTCPKDLQASCVN